MKRFQTPNTGIDELVGWICILLVIVGLVAILAVGCYLWGMHNQGIEDVKQICSSLGVFSLENSQCTMLMGGGS